jgi:Bacterial transcriptional activator domain
VVDELRDLTARFPLRERFRTQLMTGLYRSGRQTEALETYQRLYRVVSDELGVRPGPVVDELHRQIHLGGTTLQMGEDEVCAPPLRQLPAGIGWFSGRTQILARLDALLEHATTTTAVIAGGPGMVKTALAVHLAHQVSGDFPDGQLYLDLRGFHASGHPLHGQPPGCRPASTRRIRSNLCLTPPVAVCAAWERRWHEMTRTP